MIIYEEELKPKTMEVLKECVFINMKTEFLIGEIS